jgi:phage gp45-like
MSNIVNATKQVEFNAVLRCHISIDEPELEFKGNVILDLCEDDLFVYIDKNKWASMSESERNNEIYKKLLYKVRNFLEFDSEEY